MSDRLRGAALLAAALVTTALAPAAPTPAAPARPQDAAPAKAPLSLADELAKHRRGVRLEHGALAGDGATFLLDEARASQFVLVGEDHGLADVPRVNAALFRLLEPAGYHHLAVEAGPLTAAYLGRLATERDPGAAFARFNHDHPYALPFFGWKEEADMLAADAAVSPARGGAFWGLDQEFILSPQVHFERLVELAPNARARAVAGEYFERVRTEFAKMVESKNPGALFLVTATAADFARLREAFGLRAPSAGSDPGSAQASTKGAEARPVSPALAEAARIVDELEVSWEIYAKNFANEGYASNAQRAALMRKHFLEYYRVAERAEHAPPKVLFKLGAYHTKRGRSFTNVYDIGNLASEIAAANGSKSFHLLVVVARGTQNEYRPFLANDADKRKPYDAVAAFDFMDAKPLLAAADPSAWSIVDLRPVRPLLSAHRFGKVDPALEDALYGYDAVLVIPEGQAATLFE